MIYTKGPKTSSFTENRTIRNLVGGYRHSMPIRTHWRESGLTSLYPIPIYCEGTLQPSKAISVPEGALYTIAL
jgi:hypothetical protein